MRIREPIHFAVMQNALLQSERKRGQVLPAHEIPEQSADAMVGIGAHEEEMREVVHGTTLVW